MRFDSYDVVLRNMVFNKATGRGSFVWLSLTVRKLISAREAPNPCINTGSALLVKGESCLTNVSLTCRKAVTNLRCPIYVSGVTVARQSPKL